MKLLNYLNVQSLLCNRSLKNVLVLTSGTLLSQILPILFFPILSRIYTPFDYGILGLFMSLSMLLMVISNLQLNYAVLAPKEESDALRVFFAGFNITLWFAAVTFLLVVFLGDYISTLLDSSTLEPWLYLLPLTVFFSGANVQLSAWFNRSGQFKTISTSRVVTSVVTIFFSVVLSFFLTGPGGLVISYFLGTLSSFFILAVFFTRGHAFHMSSIAEMKTVVSEHRNFPMYTLPTEVISNFAQQLPLYIFSMYSGVQSVGWFSRSRQMLALPINYISGAVSEVYKHRASEAFRNNPAALRPLFLKTFGYLFLASLVPFLLIGFFSPILFAFFFGENWRQSGVFTQSLVGMYFFKFVISPLTYNFYLVNQQRLDFILHILIIIVTSAGLFVGFYFFKSDVFALILFSVSYSFMYLIYGFLSFRFSRVRH
jgi:O-antigen/teichoic acid export membrane protein